MLFLEYHAGLARDPGSQLFPFVVLCFRLALLPGRMELERPRRKVDQVERQLMREQSLV